MNVSDAQDAAIDAALEPNVFVQDEGDGLHLLVAHVSTTPEVYVWREERRADDGTTTRTPWNVAHVASGGMNYFESPAAARNLASALFYAAQLADRLEEAGR